MTTSPENPDLPSLSALFYPAATDGPAPELGQFSRADADDLPSGYRALLAHDGHMTVTMERFHLAKVDVEVLDRKTADDGKLYSRKIRLRTQAAAPAASPTAARGRVVQFGIVRMNLDCFPPDVRRQVLSESTPLGRVLIDHGLLMKVRLIALWRIEPGPDLCRAMELDQPCTIYGRTAMIDIENAPVIELLEISAPLEEYQKSEIRIQNADET